MPLSSTGWEGSFRLDARLAGGAAYCALRLTPSNPDTRCRSGRHGRPLALIFESIARALDTWRSPLESPHTSPGIRRRLVPER